MIDFNKNANPQPSRPAILFTIASDFGGTLSLGPKDLNFSLVHYLLDATEKGHDVIITSFGNLASARDSLEMACMRLRRPLPETLRFISKFEMHKADVDIAFDDEDFSYLKDGTASTYNVKIDARGNPDISYDHLRSLVGIKDSPYAGTPSTQAPTPKAL